MKRFIHIPKNAGTSIRPHVKPFNYTDTEEELPEYIKKIGLDKHLPHSKLTPNSMFDHQFAVVRNPWARVVSLYHEKRHPHSNPYSVPFITFVAQLKDFTYNEYWWCASAEQCFAQQLDWISINDKPIIDVLSFDNLQENLSKYLGYAITLEHLNKGDIFTSYKNWYNKYTKQMVAEHFAKDIEHFGFLFDSEATKNVWYK